MTLRTCVETRAVAGPRLNCQFLRCSTHIAQPPSTTAQELSSSSEAATTSVWVNAWLTDPLRGGVHVEVAVVEEASVLIDGAPFGIDLRQKADRLLIENAAIAFARHDEGRLRNKPGVSEPREEHEEQMND